LPETAEGLLFADIDIGFIGVAKAAYGPTGHYSRPDVVRLLLNKKPGTRVHAFGPESRRSVAKRCRDSSLG